MFGRERVDRTNVLLEHLVVAVTRVSSELRSSRMALSDDFAAAITAVKTAYAQESNDIASEIARVAAAIAAAQASVAGNPSTAAITQAVADLRALAAQMATDDASLNAVAPAAPAPSPAVASASTVTTS